MVNTTSVLLGCFVATNFIASLHAQFYDPDTDYHDIAQRVSVVEMARVLAWRENAARPTIKEIKYTVSRDEKGQTTWNIQWLTNATSGRQARVQYPESLLLEGSEFYRIVFRQLWSAGWRPVDKSEEKTIATAFWKGADRAESSRLDGVDAAFKLLETKMPEAERSATLAGLLQASAVPMVSGAVSLDAVLLARSAVWLCLAEQTIAERSGGLDAYWAPILFLAGRENAAAALWKKDKIAGSGDAFRAWDFLLQRQRAKDAYIFAAKPENARFALPIMTYYARVAWIGSTIADVLPLLAKEPDSVMRLVDYTPFIAVNTGVAGGRFMEGALPVLARARWLQTMRSVPAIPFDYRAYTNVLEKTLAEVERASKKPADDDESDRSTFALKAAAPMLREAFEAGTGALVPVATASSRDLLNYGWETTCLNIDTRHRFVARQWGIKELAESIRTNSWSHVTGLPIFSGAFIRRASSTEQSQAFAHLQFVDLSELQTKDLPVQVWGKDAQDDASLYGRRCWLRPGQAAMQVARLTRTSQLHEVVPFIKRLRAEGGPSFDLALLDYLVNQIPHNTASRMPGKQRLQEDLAQELTEPSILQVNVLWEKKYRNMPYFDRAREFEKLFWESPTTRVHVWAYENYIMAHAYKAASRFYDQVSEILDEPIQFSNQLGMERWVQAWLAGDKEAMKKAMSDSNSGSANHMLMLMWQAVVDNDLKTLERWNAESIERYGRSRNSDSMQQRFKAFLPLLAALQNPSHADRTKALDYFASDSGWAVMQWIMIKQYGLSTADAIRFLGGEDTDDVRRAMVLYLKKDKERFAQQFDKIKDTETFSRSRFILVTSMRNELLEVPVPSDQLDLKPKNVETIAQAVFRAAGVER